MVEKTKKQYTATQTLLFGFVLGVTMAAIIEPLPRLFLELPGSLLWGFLPVIIYSAWGGILAFFCYTIAKYRGRIKEGKIKKPLRFWGITFLLMVIFSPFWCGSVLFLGSFFAVKSHIISTPQSKMETPSQLTKEQ